MKKHIPSLIAFFTIIVNTALFQQANAQNKIAFIYNADSTIASSYDSLLTMYGFDVTLINQPDVPTFNFKPYQLLIAGPNSSNTWTKWYNQENADTVIKANKRILALGQYGAGLFKVMNLWINGGQTAS